MSDNGMAAAAAAAAAGTTTASDDQKQTSDGDLRCEVCEERHEEGKAQAEQCIEPPIAINGKDKHEEGKSQAEPSAELPPVINGQEKEGSNEEAPCAQPSDEEEEDEEEEDDGDEEHSTDKEDAVEEDEPDADDEAWTAADDKLWDKETERDYYAALGISRNSTISDSRVRTAYHRLSRKWHPQNQRNQRRRAGLDPDAWEARYKELLRKFWVVMEAYLVLKDPERRRIYDECGLVGLRNSERFYEKSLFEMDAFQVYEDFFEGKDPEDRDFLLMNGNIAVDSEDSEEEDGDAEDLEEEEVLATSVARCAGEDAAQDEARPGSPKKDLEAMLPAELAAKVVSGKQSSGSGHEAPGSFHAWPATSAPVVAAGPTDPLHLTRVRKRLWRGARRRKLSELRRAPKRQRQPEVCQKEVTEASAPPAAGVAETVDMASETSRALMSIS